jgi:ubiquinone/menaquinone biosynthesis C-methylase UbiE
MPYRQVIAAAYDAGVSEEYSRLTATASGHTEFRIMTDLLDEFIQSGSVVIDIGAGPGRYAEYLLRRNCTVGLVDLSARSLKAFSDRIESSRYSKNILFNQVSCATQLNWINDNIADAILLMGPLYHLVNEEHRSIALANCRRILKPGGFLFTIFLAPDPLVQKCSEKTFSSGEIAGNTLHSSITSTCFQGFDVPQFRCNPEKAEELMLNTGFEPVRIRNLDRICPDIPHVNHERKQSYPSEDKQKMPVGKSHWDSHQQGEFKQYVCVANAIK